MKKTLLILSSLAALALAGCTKVENFSSHENTGKEIGFATYTGRAVTKGITAGTQLQQSFSVEGFVSGNPVIRYFYATSYRYNGSGYTGDTTRYWPVSYDNVDFYASSPLQYTNTSGAAVNLKPVDSTFTVTGTDGTTDIVAARLVNVESETDPVTLVFGHKLTKVSFKAVGFDATKTFKIAKITLEAKSGAKYSYGAADSWTDSTDTYEYTFCDDERIIPVSTTTPVAVGDTLFLIPSQAATVKAKISYSIYDGPVRIDTTTSPVEVNLPVANVWGINKSVIYKLTLNITSSKKPINFSASYGDWDADTTVNVPPLHYVEEGVDYGEGTKIGSVVWAPVNVGYNAVLYKYGRIFQWGRKYGSGYKATNATSVYNDAGDLLQTLTPGPIDVADESPECYYDISGYNREPYDWATDNYGNDVRWNAGTESDPVKTIYDPCPTGWRVPTLTELKSLIGGNDEITTVTATSDIHGSSSVSGIRLDGGNGSSTTNYLFLPLTGECNTGGGAGNREVYGSYWCSVVSETSTGNHHHSMTMYVKTGLAKVTNCARAYGCAVRCVAD